jgi:transforming growth factor-beta-induced protein
MKTNRSKKFFLTVAIVMMSLALVACSDDDDNDDDDALENDSPEITQNIVETAIADGNFTTLVAALQAAGLDDDLQGPGPFTVFAPTDDAFNKLPAGTVDALLEPANQQILIDLLTYHVLPGNVSAQEAIALAGTRVEMLNGGGMSIDVVGGSVILNQGGNRQATVTVTDIRASNGIIHVIDTVLDPEDAAMDIVETAVANGNFTTLVAALQAAGLDDDLQGSGPFTVFAPTDEAFDKLPSGTVDALLEPANQAALIDLLSYHVIAGDVRAADAIALAGGTAQMLNGDLMAIDVMDGSVILNMGGLREAVVVTTDVLASNGVIHVIDTVLDPLDAP